jgi:hypothetical protein
MEKNYLNKYLKYKQKYFNLKQSLSGGTIRVSKAYKILNSLTVADGILDPDTINNIPSDGSYNAGVLFIGSLSSEPENIRVLCGKSNNTRGSQLDTFGGRIERGETILIGVIREVIEEIFNFPPTDEIINMLSKYFNKSAKDSYKIIELAPKSYCYIFDISTLGNIIEIMNLPRGAGKNNSTFLKYMIKGKFNNNASVPNIKKTDFKEGAPIIMGQAPSVTINLQSFMRERQIPGVPARNGLNEVLVIGFPSINKLLKEAGEKPFIYNFTNEREGGTEELPTRSIFGRLLKHPAVQKFTV